MLYLLFVPYSLALNSSKSSSSLKAESMDEPILDNDFSFDRETTIEQAELATFWMRLGASLVDFMILFPLLVLNLYNTLHFKSLGIMLLLTTAAALYKPYFEWKRSATFGKTALGIKLVDYNMNDISMEQAFKRYFPWAINFFFSTLSNFHVFFSPDFAEVDDFMQIGYLAQEAPLTTVNTFYSFVFLFLVGSLLFDVKRQGAHDKVAGTYCIVGK